MKTSKTTNRVNSIWVCGCVLMCAVILSCGMAHAGQPDFEAVGTRLIEAVEAGELTPEQAKAMMGALACVSFEERLNESLGQRAEHEDERFAAYRAIESRIRRATETGRLTPEDAEKRLIEIRTRMFVRNEEREEREEEREEISEEDRGEQREEVREEVREEDYAVEVWFQKVGERLKAAVKEGDLSEEEAWDTWYEIKEKGFIPRLKAAVESGGMTREKAEAIWRDIEKAEAGERLKAAVRKGEISEEEAIVKWQVITKEKQAPGAWIEDNFNKLGLNEEKLAGIREHLKTSGLTDEQVEKALRGLLKVVYVRKAEGESYKMNPQMREYFEKEAGLTDEQIDKVQRFANRIVNGMRPMPGKREE